MRRPLAMAALAFCAAAWLLTLLLPLPWPYTGAVDGKEAVCAGIVSDLVVYTDTGTGRRVRLLYLKDAAWEEMPGSRRTAETSENHSESNSSIHSDDHSNGGSNAGSDIHSKTHLNSAGAAGDSGEDSRMTFSIICRLQEGESLPQIGSCVRCEGEVRLFRTATNPGEFDARDYYYGQGYAFELRDVRITGKSREFSHYRQALYLLKSRMGEALEALLSPKEASVVRAMLLGEKKGMDTQIKELYQNAGISHIVAISGLHISILCMGAYNLFSRFIGRTPSGILSCGFLLSFLCMTGFSASSMRAGLMFCCLLTAKLIGRTYDTPTALALAAALLLIGNPARLWQTGFLLSFAAAFGASVVVPAFGRMDGWKQWQLRLRYGEGRRYEEKKSGSFREKLCQGLRSSFCVSMVTLPIVLSSFYEWNVLSIPVNLVVIPLMGILLGGCIVLALCGSLLLSLGGGLALLTPVAVLVKGILFLYESLCKIAGWEGLGRFRPGAPQIWQIIVFYALFGALLWFREKIPRVFAYLFVSLLCIVFLIHPGRGTQLTMLDVGQGDCIYIRSGQGRHYLYDGGSTSNSLAGTWQLIPFLKHQGVNRLELIFVSHWDADHINAVEAVLEWAQKGGVKIGGLVLGAAGPQDELLLGLLQKAQAARIPVYRMEAGESIEDGTSRFDALYPSQDMHAGERNETSLVLRYSEGREGREDFSVLLTGDLESGGENSLLQEDVALESLLLKVAHHGSDTSSGSAFLQAVRPRAALISCGRDNSYGHPHAAVLARLTQEKIPYYVTAECGAISVRVRDGELWLETFLESGDRNKEKNKDKNKDKNNDKKKMNRFLRGMLLYTDASKKRDRQMRFQAEGNGGLSISGLTACKEAQGIWKRG